MWNLNVSPEFKIVDGGKMKIVILIYLRSDSLPLPWIDKRKSYFSQKTKDNLIKSPGYQGHTYYSGKKIIVFPFARAI